MHWIAKNDIVFAYLQDWRPAAASGKIVGFRSFYVVAVESEPVEALERGRDDISRDQDQLRPRERHD
jgi:hypothetical protein